MWKLESEDATTNKKILVEGVYPTAAIAADIASVEKLSKQELVSLLTTERSASKKLANDFISLQKSSQALTEKLSAVKNKLLLAAELGKLGIWEYDPKTKQFEFGEEFYSLYATDVASEGRFMTFEQYIKEFVYPADYGQFEDRRKFLVAGGGTDFSDLVHRVVRRDGEIRDIIVRRRVILDDNKHITRIYGTNQDITAWVKGEKAREQQAKMINEMAYFDALTGLPNRYQLNEWLNTELKQAQSQGSSGVVLLINLDDLKMLNDTCGHSFGDKIIIEAGNKIVESVATRGFIARIGGDEFVVVLKGEYKRASIEELAQEISRTLAETHKNFDKTFHLTASIGIAIYPENGDTAEEIIKNADNAMYAAKKFSKNSWRFYTAEMQLEAHKKMQLIGSLRYALQRREFYLVYQPQICLKSNAIVGFEALLRWNSLEHGLISPLQFIPLAEQSGLINNMGKWVLLEACKFIKQMDALAGNIHIAVNISAKQIIAADFIASILKVIGDTGIKPSQLEIEITESIMLTSMEEVIYKLNELKAIGVKISLDDFGTGFSSLTYLRRLPVEILKLDKSFIDMITIDVQGAKIIASIINMAHTVNMKVVAEGVETQQQLDYLHNNNCDIIQGYIFSKPVMPESALALLEAFRENR